MKRLLTAGLHVLSLIVFLMLAGIVCASASLFPTRNGWALLLSR